jgi:F0F1-type ATP synthase membrane subunit c/vacuolar-type H+-ATPase subunit K
MGRGVGEEQMAQIGIMRRTCVCAASATSLGQAYLLASTIGMFAANSRLISKSRRRSI